MRSVNQIFALFSFFVFLPSAAGLFSQAPLAVAAKSFQYTMKSNDGTNGSAVAYDPVKNVYVTVIAGNASFPLEGFDANGRSVFSVEAGFDFRGMWYNSAAKRFEGNGAGSSGYVAFTLSNNNMPTIVQNTIAGQNQPEFQSVGCFYAKKKKVCFLNVSNGSIDMYAPNKAGKPKSVKLNSTGLNNLNTYGLGYTGVSGYEFVCLDFVKKSLVFFNAKGSMTGVTKLPAGAPVYDTFAFSYANGHAFLYDKEDRVWHAYKVF